MFYYIHFATFNLNLIYKFEDTGSVSAKLRTHCRDYFTRVTPDRDYRISINVVYVNLCHLVWKARLPRRRVITTTLFVTTIQILLLSRIKICLKRAICSCPIIDTFDNMYRQFALRRWVISHSRSKESIVLNISIANRNETNRSRQKFRQFAHTDCPYDNVTWQ